jgi:hypothetical protein
VTEFVLPVLGATTRRCSSSSTACGSTSGSCSQPLLAPLFEIETTHYFSILPTATPYARNALFSGLFPGEIAARLPDWWGERDDESLNAHEREMLELQLREHELRSPVRYAKISTAADSDDLERTSAPRSRRTG